MAFVPFISPFLPRRNPLSVHLHTASPPRLWKTWLRLFMPSRRKAFLLLSAFQVFVSYFRGKCSFSSCNKALQRWWLMGARSRSSMEVFVKRDSRTDESVDRKILPKVLTRQWKCRSLAQTRKKLCNLLIISLRLSLSLTLSVNVFSASVNMLDWWLHMFHPRSAFNQVVNWARFYWVTDHSGASI